MTAKTRTDGRINRLALIVFATIVVVGVANAHVTIWPREVTAKSFQAFTVRVPTEKDVPTIQIRLAFPPGIEVLRFKPKEGWKYEIERDAAGTIVGVTWSGGKIGREEYEEFAFVGRVGPNPGPVMFKAYQTYQGGEVVDWVNAEEPHPGPKVMVLPVATTEGAAPADPFAAGNNAAARTDRPAGSERSTLPTVLSGVALAIALAALFRSRKAS